jgi:hypothetical protein
LGIYGWARLPFPQNFIRLFCYLLIHSFIYLPCYTCKIQPRIYILIFDFLGIAIDGECAVREWDKIVTFRLHWSCKRPTESCPLGHQTKACSRAKLAHPRTKIIIFPTFDRTVKIAPKYGIYFWVLVSARTMT